MKRRDLLKAGTVGVGAAAANALPGWAQAGAGGEPDCRVDVLVIGGGTAGTIAALQAARAGARTMLVEMGSQLGGTMTTGGVWWPGLFHAWEKQIIAGIGWELVSKTVALDGGTMPDFATPAKHHWEHQVPINGLLYAALAEEACLAAGLMVCYYEFPQSVAEIGDGWLVETVGKGIRRRIACRQLIDCTGGADVVGMIGLPRLREAETQPGTLVFRFGGYDVKTLDADRIDQRYREALAKGELSEGDYSETNGRFIHFLQTAGVAHHVFLADSSTSATKTATNLAGRASMLRLLRFVRSLPGCERTTLTRMHPETAVRETFRIVGEVQITQEDYTNGRVFNDAIGYTFYPIDVHGRSGVNPQPLKRGVVPTLPLGALIPKGSRNLLVAGRSISSDRLANSALRVQASCMAMGQAAGAAAALAASQERTPAKVPIDAVRDVLRKHGAILPA
jgi:hypothetical protein